MLVPPTHQAGGQYLVAADTMVASGDVAISFDQACIFSFLARVGDLCVDQLRLLGICNCFCDGVNLTRLCQDCRNIRFVYWMLVSTKPLNVFNTTVSH